MRLSELAAVAEAVDPSGRSAWRPAAGLLAVALTACGLLPGGDAGSRPSPAPEGARTELADPCPGIEPVGLGRPFVGGEVARFTVEEAGRLWITARDFPHGGIFDPDVWRTRVSLGSTDVLPTYDERRSVVTDVEVQVDVVEDTWSGVDVDAGGHWLWSSNGGHVLLKSCDEGVTDAVPVDADDRRVR